MIQNCGNCKHYKQLISHSVCDSPNQDDQSLKEYAYWFFGTQCKYYEKGSHESRFNLNFDDNVFKKVKPKEFKKANIFAAIKRELKKMRKK